MPGRHAQGVRTPNPSCAQSIRGQGLDTSANFAVAGEQASSIAACPRNSLDLWRVRSLVFNGSFHHLATRDSLPPSAITPPVRPWVEAMFNIMRIGRGLRGLI